MTVDGDDGDVQARSPGAEQRTRESSDGEQQAVEPTTDEQPTEGEATDGQPTVTVGPDESGEPGTTAELEHAVPDADGRFDWRGWLLVAVVVVSFLVVPGIVLLRPVRVVGFRTTYLLLPLLPAVVLGATAVWVAVRSRQG